MVTVVEIIAPCSRARRLKLVMEVPTSTALGTVISSRLRVTILVERTPTTVTRPSISPARITSPGLQDRE